jgi:acetyltransferase-like isoleucine patch superfamily enzyme
VRIGSHVSIGNDGDVQYEAEIGDFVRIHSYVAVGSGSRIGPFCWIHPFVVLTNDRLFPIFAVPEPCVLAPFCVIAVHSTLLPGAVLGVHVIAGSGSEIAGRVPSFSFLKGAPAERVIDARRVVHKVAGKIWQPYPWLKHIDRDYPWKDVPPAERRVEDWVPAEWKEFL